jgi:hypothetical protein
MFLLCFCCVVGGGGSGGVVVSVSLVCVVSVYV